MDPALALANDIARLYGALPQVQAVALAGSYAAGTAGDDSDIDLYVYSKTEISLDDRAAIATTNVSCAEIGNQFWESGDEWIDAQTGIHIDVMFRSTGWIEEQIDRVLQQHQASLGYSTCLWHNVLTSKTLYDREGWFATLQRRAAQPYPKKLRQAILAKNYPILRRTMSSYVAQLTKATVRNDWVSINHRIAELLTSYYDCLFALNRLPHPGEKRLIEIASRQCDKTPVDMSEQVRALIEAGAGGDQSVIVKANALLENLDKLLIAEGPDLAGIVCRKTPGVPSPTANRPLAGNISIRSATTADAPIVVQFLRAMVCELESLGDHPVSKDQEQWPHMDSEIQDGLENTKALHLLAEVASPSPTPIGWAYARITNLERIYEPACVLHISALYVSRPYRKRGIGQAMLDRLLEWGRDAGCVEAELNVLVNNPARSLYQKTGFGASHTKMTRKL